MRHARSLRRHRAAPRIAAFLAIGLLAGAGTAVALADELPWLPTAEPTAEPTTPSTPTPTPTPTPPPDAVFTLVAAGDVLTHQSVNISARSGSGYDFAPLFDPVTPWVAGADLALCHMEVPVAPAGASPSGFPRFAAPKQVVAGLAANGWDGCSTASNHSVDRGEAGVMATLDALETAGLGHVGTARDAEQAAAPQLYRLRRAGQTIVVAHIAASYGSNGLPIAAPHLLNLIDTDDLIAQATAARENGADVVVASVHCCVEYQTAPTARQQEIATALADSGQIDLLIGHHAHVPQPVALLPGGPRGDGMWVAYGLGNFISNQGSHAGLSRATENGLLLTATFRKPREGPVTVESVEWTAITVDRRAGHLVQPLSALAAAGGSAGTLSASDIAARHALVADAAGSAAPERTTPPEPTGPPPMVVHRPPANVP